MKNFSSKAETLTFPKSHKYLVPEGTREQSFWREMGKVSNLDFFP